MRQYLDLLDDVLRNGTRKDDRTGTGTISVFGRQMRFDLRDGFPLLTTKRVFWKGVVAELLWLVAGQTNIRPLVEQGVSIWTDWPLKTYNEHRKQAGEPELSMKEFESLIRADAAFAERWGALGPVYGQQWRHWMAPQTDGGAPAEIDQLAEVVRTLRTNPDSRRIIVSAWNPADIARMALPPCHALFQFNSRPDADGERVLDCQLYQRSCDLFLGVPFNIASYALLTAMIARVTGHKPGEFVWTGGDVHIYTNHVTQAREQLSRAPRALPTIQLDPTVTEVDDFRMDHIQLNGYDPHPAIKAEVSV